MSMIPAPNCFGNCPNPGGIYVNSLVAGCPPSHPNSQPPNCAPPQPPTPPIPGISTNFTNNIQNGFNSFGCQFVYKRTSIQRAKLLLLQNSINPNSPLGQQLEPILIDYGQGVIQGPPPNLPTPPPPPPPSPNPNNPIPYPGTGMAVPMNPNFASFGGWSNQAGVSQRANTGGTSLPPYIPNFTTPIGPGPGTTTGTTGITSVGVQCVNCSSNQAGAPPPPPTYFGGQTTCPTGWVEASMYGGPGNYYQNCPPAPTNIYMQAWNIFSGGTQPAGSVGTNANWQQMLQNRINWLNNFALQNCTGGPTPPPPTPPFPPTGMVVCDSCNGGLPVSNMFPNSCPPGWIASGTGNPCASTGGPTPPPPNPNTGIGTGGGIVNNGFTSY